MRRGRRRSPTGNRAPSRRPTKIVRQRLPDAQRERALRGEALPEPRRAEPAVLVVDGGHASGRHDLQAVAHRVDELVVRGREVPIAELPGGLLAQHAGRLPALVELDHAARRLRGRRPRRQPGRVEPERVVVARHERGRRVARHGVERLPGRLDHGRPVAAAPASARAASGPGSNGPTAASTRASASSSDAVPSSRTSRWASAQVGKWTCASLKSRQDAPAAEIDVIGRRKRLLVRPDAARDPIPGDRQRQHHRHRRVHRADDAVLENHGRTVGSLA